MGYETILYEVEERVATITLNRPDKLNAYVPEMGNEIVAAAEKGREEFTAFLDRLNLGSEQRQQLISAGQDEDFGSVIPRRSEYNHMDPCFRFPEDELRELFDGATLTEAMLVALEHMQVNYVTISGSGLRKFRRNTISFPQDTAEFACRQQFMKGYRLGDRVNSRRGPGEGAAYHDLNRPPKRGVDATPRERELFAVDEDGYLQIPGKVVQVLPDFSLEVEYQHGGRGLELPENLRPRVVMPPSTRGLGHSRSRLAASFKAGHVLRSPLDGGAFDGADAALAHAAADAALKRAMRRAREQRARRSEALDKLPGSPKTKKERKKARRPKRRNKRSKADKRKEAMQRKQWASGLLTRQPGTCVPVV